MASSTTLNAANLETLGAARLAQLLLEISLGDGAAKRRLRLALAANGGAGDAAREVTKRLTSIARSKTFLDWEKIKPFAADLDAQRRAILDSVAPKDPQQGFDLMWRLAACAELVYARTDDGSGRLSAVFDQAVLDLGPLAHTARLDSADLAARAFQALCNDDYGSWNALVPALAPQLGQAGLRALKKQMKAWQAEPAVVPPAKERRVIGWASSGKIYADQIDSTRRRHTAASVLCQVADALGDADGYIAQFDAKTRKLPAVATEIARRLLTADRAQEAWATLEAIPVNSHACMPFAWEEVRIDTLEALGRSDDAQSFRWERFSATLTATHLRAYLRKLPDFEDFEAEQRALAHALAYSDIHQALTFLIGWPDLPRANQLVLARPRQLNGNFYEVLTPSAEALAEKHPLSATLLLRAMIDFTLGQSRATRYKHAARHLRNCASLAEHIDRFGTIPDHTTYEKSLRASHGRKAAFWQEV